MGWTVQSSWETSRVCNSRLNFRDREPSAGRNPPLCSGCQSPGEAIGPQSAERILRFLRDRVAPLDDVRSSGNALNGGRFGEFWRYRVGDFRVIARIEDAEALILVLRLGNRREVYR
jgi:mRNA interferase RelE/StbE